MTLKLWQTAFGSQPPTWPQRSLLPNAHALEWPLPRWSGLALCTQQHDGKIKCTAASTLASWNASSGGSQMPLCKDSQAARGEAHSERNWGPWPIASTNLPATCVSHVGRGSCSPGWQLDCNLRRGPGPKPPRQAAPKFLTSRYSERQ